MLHNPLTDQAWSAFAGSGITSTTEGVHQRIDHVHAFTARLSAEGLPPRSKAAAELTKVFEWLRNEELPSG